MKTYEVRVAVKTLEFYRVEAESAEEAEENWWDGELVHTSDEALDAEVLTVTEEK